MGVEIADNPSAAVKEDDEALGVRGRGVKERALADAADGMGRLAASVVLTMVMTLIVTMMMLSTTY